MCVLCVVTLSWTVRGQLVQRCQYEQELYCQLRNSDSQAAHSIATPPQLA